MAESVPQKEDFERAERYDKYKENCKMAITIISAGAAIYGVSQIQNLLIDNCLAIILVVISLLSTYYSARFNETYRRAERTRRAGFLDNTFNTRLADIPSAGYYDTDEVEYGMKKLMSNLHESCLLTCRVTEKMFVKTEKLLLLWLCTIVILSLINALGTLFVVALIDVFLSKEILDDYIELKKLHAETDNIQQECKRISENASKAGWKVNYLLLSEILQVFLHYETSLSYASIMLDTEIYNKLNAKATREWKGISERYYR